MKYELRLTADAARDLEEIYDYIAERGAFRNIETLKTKAPAYPA